MKRLALMVSVVLVLAPAGWASLAQNAISSSDVLAGLWVLRFFEGTEYQQEFAVQRHEQNWMPGFATEGMGTVFPNTRTKVSISPSVATPDDEITLEVSCWVPASNYDVEQADLNIDGQQITLDLHWASSGIGFQAFTWRTYTTSLGKLEAGTYMVRVTNTGAASSTVTKSFVVREFLRAQLK